MVTHEEFIAKYSGKGFYFVYPLAGLFVFLSVVGIFGNANIVWASARKSSLRSNCNLLIAYNAFFDIFHQSAHFILAYSIFSDQNFMPLKQCFWYQFLPVFGMNFGGFVVLSIGLDRFYSVFRPASYQSLDPRIYLTLMMVPPAAFSIFLNYTAWLSVKSDPNALVICVIAEAYHAKAKDIWGLGMLVVNSLIIVVYAGVWIVIFVKSGTNPIDRRIMRSLTVVMVLVLCGWFLTSATMLIAIMFNIDEEQMFELHMIFGLTVNFSIAMNYPVYFAFSKEYRRAFLEQLQIMSCGFYTVKSSVKELHGITSRASTFKQ